MAFTARLKVPGAGTLDQRVQLFDVPLEVQDVYGQPSVAPPALIGTFWASIRLLSATERVVAELATTVATHQVMLRWLGSAIPPTATNPGGLILPGMYLIVVTDGSRLDVIEADNYRRAKVYWVLKCQQRTVI